MKKIKVRVSPSPEQSSKIPTFGANNLAAEIIRRRSLCFEYGEKFFGSTKLSDPFAIKDMGKAVEIALAALDNNEKITIYGDYDCDGVTSTVIIYRFLFNHFQSPNIHYRLPDRFVDGYGLNMRIAEDFVQNGTKLLITVDNGISSPKEIKYLKENGVKVIVTDHHTLSENTPSVVDIADAVINPHRPDDTSEFKDFAGCGVALKFIYALFAKIEGIETSGEELAEELFGLEEIFAEYLELAAIGTLGDCVNTGGENRYIIERGLKLLEFTENSGLRELLKQCGFAEISKTGKQYINSQNVQFYVVPRINSAGRLEHAKIAADLFLSDIYEQKLETSEDSEEGQGPIEIIDCRQNAEELSRLNVLRREIQPKIVAEAELFLSRNPERIFEKVIVVYGENWHKGVVGLVASTLLEKFEKPAVVISIDGEKASGSMRSVAGFSAFEMLDFSKDLLSRYGGHECAGGFSLKTDDISKFIDKIEEFSNTLPTPHLMIEPDIELFPHNLPLISLSMLDDISALEPFGEGNPRPVFLFRDMKILNKSPLSGGKYTAFTVGNDKNNLRIADFSSTYDNFRFKVGEYVDIVSVFSEENYKGVTKVRVHPEYIRLSGINDERFFAAESTFFDISHGKSFDEKLKSRILPTKDDVKVIYDVLRNTTFLSDAAEKAYLSNLNYCKFRIIIDMLSFGNLIEVDHIQNRIHLIPTKEKVDIFLAPIYLHICGVCFSE